MTEEPEAEIEIEVEDLLTTLQSFATELGNINARLARIEEIIVSDHEKLEEIGAHATQDHERLDNLERTGRITVKPVGL